MFRKNDRVKLRGTNKVGTVTFVSTGTTMVTVQWDGGKELVQFSYEIELV